MNRLREIRSREGLTLQELGDLSGLSEAMISRLERGERSTSPRVKVRLARVLGVRVAELFDAEELPELVGSSE